jgi:hypothetical protein
MLKQYLGDSVYAETDTYGIWLTTENGFGPREKIYLEPQVLQALDTYRQYIKKFLNPEEPTNDSK